MKLKVTAHSVYDLIFAASIVVWYILPVGTGAVPVLADSTYIPQLLHTWNLGNHFAAALFAVHLAPAFAVYRIAVFISPLATKRYLGAESPIEGIARVFISTGMLACSLVPLLNFADSASWFKALPPAVLASAALVITLQCSSVIVLLKTLTQRNPLYAEYREFRKTNTEVQTNKTATFLSILFKIRTKLFVAFIGIIAIILSFLSFILLNNYRATLLDAIRDGARSQVEQAAATYRINLGDSIAMFEYLNRQKELNETAKFAYQDLVLYTNLRSAVYLDDSDKNLSDFRAEYSSSHPDTQFPDLPSFSETTARELLEEMNRSGAIGTMIRTDTEANTVSYIRPMIRTDTVRQGDERIRKQRLMGFSVMTFNRNIIMRPYYRTRVSVFAYTAIFIYFSVIMTYIIGSYIVNPLLFLRMNVRKISTVLSGMIHGKNRIASSAIVYKDAITSRDEIKHLSGEINDMVTIIRGIVPYISASTLKQAETGQASTTRKELAFLFTDIRGFTTLCEGMESEQVVTILNRYLDLETEIIIQNNGDVDKFVGDEMMAFFEGPDKEVNACRAAMEIRQAMMEEKEKRERDGLPVVSIGIGINTGTVVFGSVGARDRMDFTSIGDTVNLAARLEGANKAYGSKSLISEAVYDKVQEVFICRQLDMITVKGKNEPVRIFEILQETSKAQQKHLDLKKNFEKGLAAYRKCSWESAKAAFQKNVDSYHDAPSEVYLDRISHFEKNPPPENWDGVFRMTVK